jgi:GTPase SAR1 family protein
MRARDNPFAVHRVLAFRYQWSEVDWARQLDRLRTMSYQAAIVGPHGSGKTTLLEDLASRLETVGQATWTFRLHTGDRQFPARQFNEIRELPDSTIVMLDGAEQLSYWQWRRFSAIFRQSGRPLVVTLHSAGRWPTWMTSSSDVEILDQIVDRLHPDSGVETRRINRQLFEKHRGNIRDALREWYDIFARGAANETPCSPGEVRSAKRKTMDDTLPSLTLRVRTEYPSQS